jgi:hypothetical protein
MVYYIYTNPRPRLTALALQYSTDTRMEYIREFRDEVTRYEYHPPYHSVGQSMDCKVEEPLFPKFAHSRLLPGEVDTKELVFGAPAVGTVFAGESMQLRSINVGEAVLGRLLPHRVNLQRSDMRNFSEDSYV